MTDHEKQIPLEVIFPVEEKDIFKLLKGAELNLLYHVPGLCSLFPHINNDAIHFKVFSSDRIKRVSLKNWHKIQTMLYDHPGYSSLMHDLEQDE